MTTPWFGLLCILELYVVIGRDMCLELGSIKPYIKQAPGNFLPYGSQVPGLLQEYTTRQLLIVIQGPGHIHPPTN